MAVGRIMAEGIGMSNKRPWLRGLAFWGGAVLAGLYALVALGVVWLDLSGLAALTAEV